MKIFLQNLLPTKGQLRGSALLLLLLGICFGCYLLFTAGSRLILALQTPEWIHQTAHYSGSRLAGETVSYPDVTITGEHSSYFATLPGKPTLVFSYAGIEQTIDLDPPLFSKPRGEVQIAYDPQDSYRIRLDGTSLRTDLIRTFSIGTLLVFLGGYSARKLLKAYSFSLQNYWS